MIKGQEHVTGVALTDGAELPADLVIAGIGVNPEITLAQQCNLTVDNGIVTDAQCRTDDPAIYRDRRLRQSPDGAFRRPPHRLESVHNAIEGAKIATAAILGKSAPALEAPWFWSDQYDLKLQIAGLFQGYDHVAFRGVCRSRSFAAFYYKGGQTHRRRRRQPARRVSRRQIAHPKRHERRAGSADR